jgi:hypothetical protein
MRKLIKIIIFVPLLVILGLYGLVRVIINNEVRSPIAIMVQHDNNIETNDNFHNWELIKNNYIYRDLPKQQKLKIKHILIEKLPNIDSSKDQNHFSDDLTKISQSSQHIYKLAKVHHWRKLRDENKKLQTFIKDLETNFPSKTRQFKKLIHKIDLLNTAIANKDSQIAMRNSNQITFIVAEMNKNFPKKIPMEVTLLNYYERELEIWIPTENKPWLTKIAKNINRNWLSIRPLVLAHGNKTEVHKFDMLIATLNHSSLFNEYSRITTLLQKEQDNLEQVFQ